MRISALRSYSLSAALTVSVVVGVAGAAVGGVGCASHTVLPDDVMARLGEEHQGELLYLKQSVYAGQFYDDDRYRLVHPRRFEELTYLQTAEGDPIPPLPADEIIPAGTRVRIEKIEWPDGDAIFRRPLYTPRYTTWIFLRVARSRGEVTMERQDRHILLMPGGIGDESTFEEWFDATLSREDPNPWLRSLPDDQRVAIDQKKPRRGMNYEALTASLGFPDRISREQQDGHTVEVGVWGPISVVLKDGVVERFSAPSGDSAPVASPAGTDAPADAVAPPEAPAEEPPLSTDAPGPASTDSASTDSASTDSASTDSASTDSASTDSASTDSASTEDGPVPPLVDAPGTSPVPVVPPTTTGPSTDGSGAP